MLWASRHQSATVLHGSRPAERTHTRTASGIGVLVLTGATAVLVTATVLLALAALIQAAR